MAPVPKIVLVAGSQGVGKTTLIRRFLEKRFNGKCKPTIGFEEIPDAVLLDPVSLVDDPILSPEVVQALPPEGVSLTFWEIGGKDRGRQLPRGQRPDGIILCYDVGDRSSFHRTSGILVEHRMDRHLDSECPTLLADAPGLKIARLPVVLCGTKADDGATIAISLKETAAAVEAHGLQSSVITSARTGMGVDRAIHSLVWEMMEAAEEAEAERLAARLSPPAVETWALPHLSRGGVLSDPKSLRKHEPLRGRYPKPDLVEVYHADGTGPFGARPVSTCVQLGLHHRAVHVWVCDVRTGGILLRRHSREGPKTRGQWGPSCTAEVLCYEPARSSGAAPASETTSAAAERAASEAGLEKLARVPIEHWFACTSCDGMCRELLDVFVLSLEDEFLPSFQLREDEAVRWIHYSDVFGMGSRDRSATAAMHGESLRAFDSSYCSQMTHRLQMRLVHSSQELAKLHATLPAIAAAS